MDTVDLYASQLKPCAEKLIGQGRDFEGMKKKSNRVGIGTLPSLIFVLNPVYHASGFLAALADRALDNYSTYKCAELFEDKRFFEYGLDKYYKEQNPSLPKHPTRKDLLGPKQVLKEFIVLAASALYPPFGYSLLSTSRDTYANNSVMAKRVEKAIGLGDNVKEKIESGVPESEIMGWLENIAKDGEPE